MPSKLPPKDLVRWILRNLLGVGEGILLLFLTIAAAVFVYAPVVLAVIAVGAAVVRVVISLISLAQAVAAGRYQAILFGLPILEMAAKVAFAGTAYLALLFALNVLIAGLMRQSRRRLDLVPGLVLSSVALVAYIFFSYLMILELAAFTGWGQLPFVAFFGYLGSNAALLGLLSTDLRPVSRKRLEGASGGTTAVLILAPEPGEAPAGGDFAERSPAGQDRNACRLLY
jgi:hypothetical protein